MLDIPFPSLLGRELIQGATNFPHSNICNFCHFDHHRTQCPSHRTQPMSQADQWRLSYVFLHNDCLGHVVQVESIRITVGHLECTNVETTKLRLLIPVWTKMRTSLLPVTRFLRQGRKPQLLFILWASQVQTFIQQKGYTVT